MTFLAGPNCDCGEDHWALIEPLVQVSPFGCFEWQGSHDINGYGKISHKGKSRTVHRVAYAALVGDLPRELQIDHLCRNTRCVNPEHLEPVTPRVNTLRGVGPSSINAHKVVCSRGHESWKKLGTKANVRWCPECIASEKRARRRAGLDPADDRHGTRMGYEDHGCRCRPCLVANSVASREKYEVLGPRGVTKSLAEGDERHGTANGYLNYRCRCEPCVDAGREYARFRHAERRAGRRRVPAYLEAER